ncbi:hypothetical protein RHIZ_06270 [Rhizobium skierniewicense]|uniref:hypothetical protein n=1 Tax=Rhizobium skierniewicense TaxID=984260 RepID=UPI001FADEAC4|nr:hypothetical protein [Rhizobium skierniewicense]MCI9865545.1 hypothetical protein [Rhizobium skierniewicense]
MKKGFVLSMMALLLLGSCATTSEMPLAPNMVRLDTQASGLLFTSTAGQTTLRKAAEATASRGYTHFRLSEATTARGSQMVGMQSRTTGTYNSGFYSGSTTYTPMSAPTAHVGVTVTMFNANEPEAKGAFSVAEVLKKK